MKELLAQYAAYNVWANTRIAGNLAALGEELATQDVVSSFRSVKATVTHTWSAESIWLQRLLLQEKTQWMEASFGGTTEEACAEWLSVSGGLLKFAEEQDEASLLQPLAFQDRAGRQHLIPVFEVLLHVFNHSTYHRGQLVTMGRQLGLTEMPSTDFFLFVRDRK